MKPIGWLVSVLILAGCGGPSARTPSTTSADDVPKAPSSQTADAQAADVQLAIVDYEGIQQTIARYRGRVVVMDAWSTSCPPCIKEFPHLVELHQRYGPEQLACISLSFDYEGLGKPEEQQDRVLKFLRGQGATFDNLLSSEESDVLYRKFKLAAVPAVFVYDRAGKLRKRFDNEQAKTKEEAFSYEQVGQLVAELLAEPSSPATADAENGEVQPPSAD